jgi:hypothetical protein
MKTNGNDTAKRTRNYNQKATKEQANNVLKVWKANREFRLQDTRFEDYEKIYDELDGLTKKTRP